MMSKKQQLLQRVVGGFAELVERGQVSQLMNPYTREPISRKHYLRDEEIFSKVTSTAQAYKCWREYKLERRIELVTALVNSVIKDRDQLKPIIAAEIGKSFRDIDREFDRIDRLSEKFIASGRENLREETVLNDVGKIKKVFFEPVGLALIFPYFCEPIFDSLIHLIPCLISGNGALLKPSDFHHFLGPYLEIKAKEVLGLPNLVTDLFIQPNHLPLLAEFRMIKKVVYSGSQGPAKHIFETLVRQRFIDCNLFFGGQDAAYVDETADLQLAARQVCRYGYYNNGQSYDCIKRLYVHSAIEDQFMQLLCEQMALLQFGDPSSIVTDMGPLCIQETASKTEELIGEAVSEGAICEAGGILTTDGNQNGIFLQPTLLSGCLNNMSIMQTQLLAPIVCAISVDSQAEVVNWVNENVYGTGVRIFSRKRDSYLDLIKQIEVGRIVFNSGSMLQRDLPIEGWKQSGKGKILSQLSFQEYSIPKSYNVERI